MRDESLFLCARPSLELSLALDGRRTRWMRLRIHKRDRPASAREQRSRAFVVRRDPRVQSFGDTDVQRPIRAAQHVDVEHRTTMPSSDALSKSVCGRGATTELSAVEELPFDSARIEAPLRAFSLACHERTRWFAGGEAPGESAEPQGSMAAGRCHSP